MALTSAAPILPKREEMLKMAEQVTAREKQILSKGNRLTGAIEALASTCEDLRVHLVPIMSMPTDGKEGSGSAPVPELCDHARFIYDRAIEVENLNVDIRNLISRMEI